MPGWAIGLIIVAVLVVAAVITFKVMGIVKRNANKVVKEAEAKIDEGMESAEEHGRKADEHAKDITDVTGGKSVSKHDAERYD
jgi:F0F1-type ATP synthase membrane subunit b/b'